MSPAGPKILIVDDLPDMRMIMSLSLKRIGWEIIEGVDGQEAVELAQAELPDLILMDYNMPRMDGIAACRALKEAAQTQHIPILLYSGAFSEDLKDDAIGAGASAFLSKPILPNELRDIVTQTYQNTGSAYR